MQLYGIDQAFLSVRELAERLSNLGANQIRGLARDFDKLSKFELTKLGRRGSGSARSSASLR